MDKNERPDDTIHLDVEIEITEVYTPEERKAQRAARKARIRRERWNRRWGITLFWAIVTCILLSLGFLVFPYNLTIIIALTVSGTVAAVALYGQMSTAMINTNDIIPEWFWDKTGLPRP